MPDNANMKVPNPQSNADTPFKFCLRDWIQVWPRVFKQFSLDNVGVVAAGVAFFSLLALFPLLSMTVAIYGFFSDPSDVYDLIASVSSLLPSSAWAVLNTEIMRIVTAPREHLGWGIIISALFALFSAGSGVRAIMRAMNIAYGEEETRHPLKFLSLAVFMTLSMIVFITFALAIIIAIPWLLTLIKLEGVAAFTTRILPWGVLILIFSFASGIIYSYGPSRSRAKIRWVLPGVIFTTFFWLSISVGFSVFVTHLGRYDATYGSLSAIIILLVWFWLTAMIVIMGAELNAELERQTSVDTTCGPDKPAGKRGAKMADFVI